MPRYLVVWTIRNVSGKSDTFTDRYIAHEDLEEARAEYDNVLLDPHTYIASISAVVESTDYDTHPDLIGRNREMKENA